MNNTFVIQSLDSRTGIWNDEANAPTGKEALDYAIAAKIRSPHINWRVLTHPSVFIVFALTDWGNTLVHDSAWTKEIDAIARCEECNKGEQYPKHYGFEVKQLSLDQ